MSEISPVVQKEEETKLFFLALKVVAGCGGDSEVATRRKSSNDRSPKV
jgi:hypothetical protein